ncbi:MAG: hypothetical protein K6G38_00550 [Gammaproteobacteria bacterium]|nr:hypothetical protein [Gammaproteobacteria bacterium]
MKKLFGVFLSLALALVLVGCGKTTTTKDVSGVGYEEFLAAQDGATVTIESYIQAKTDKNSYGNVNLYLADSVGAFYVYRMAVTDAQYDQLVVGQRIKITGEKASWSGEVEFAEGKSTFEMLTGTYVAPAIDLSSKFASQAELMPYQNFFVSFSGLTVEESTKSDGTTAAWLYGWDGSRDEGADIYFKVSLNGTSYSFLVESDLCNKDSDVYKAAKTLTVGATVKLEGFLYWYNGPQMHVTAITISK